jgi:hypothetical protein
MKSNFIILILLSALALLSNLHSSFSQNLPVLYSLIENKSKEIDNALADITKAGKLTQEANTYYNEAQQLQSNYDLDEKTLQKQLTKAEGKALELQVKADNLYSGAYKVLNKLCSDELNNLDVSYGDVDSYVSTANDLMNQAADKRRTASDTKNPYEKATLLNDAAGLESAAIDSFIAALQVQKGMTPESSPQSESAEEEESYIFAEPVPQDTPQQALTETPASYPVTQKSENLAIDQSVIQKYQTYVNNPEVPDPITINRDGINGASEVTMDSARNVFFAMQSGNTSNYATPAKTGIDEQQKAIADSIALLTQAAQTETGSRYTLTNNNAYQQAETINTGTDLQHPLIGGKNAEKSKGNEELISKREYVDLSYSQQSTGVRFMVQIAASRIPLSRSQLWAIYPGNLSVEVIEEEGWFKYRIVNFRVFSAANRVAVESGVKSAWVLSILDGKQISLVESREMTKVLESEVKRYGKDVIKDGIDFYIQVAASRSRLNENERKTLCRFSNGCREIIEGGWFKYQLYAGTKYNEALELRNRYSGRSFIVAYQNGKKIKMNKIQKE